MPKPLPKKLSKELFLKLNYASCRFMKSKRAYRTDYNPKNNWFTAKIEEGDEDDKKIKMLHIHLRTPATDKWFKEEEDLDVDLYIHEKDFKELKQILEEHIDGNI